MVKTNAEYNDFGFGRFHPSARKIKTAFAIFAAALCAAAVPAKADTVQKPAEMAVDNDDDPFSDDLGLADRPVFKGEDATFANLHSSWKRLDNGGMPAARATIYIPTGRPVDSLSLTSNFGARNDPFNGRVRMHKGLDIRGPVGTPIYAAADGIINRSQWMNGYGNLIEINHGNDTATRYGHLSKLLVKPNERVRRGQLIGLMGSTGRSTGSHLHYEIRVAGVAINPEPFITGSERAMALNSAGAVALGGPTGREEKMASK
ncbi:MAG: M23 family metallopeptidase [Sphingobium sp.]|nr:M23 family metallopeptidase [Sphingobium sp.]